MGQVKGGWHETNEATLKYQQEMQLAKEESTKYKEENEVLQKKLEELDGLKDEIYAQICEAYILRYKPGEDIGIDDVEISEEFVNEEG